MTVLYPGGVTPVPEEHVQRSRPTTMIADDEWVQCNVRIRRSMLSTLDERRKRLGLSRDDWFRHIIEWALLQPPGTSVHARNGRRRR